VQPVRKSATWTRAGTPEDALGVIEAYARSHNGRVKKSGGELTLHFGSRLAYRLMGLSTNRIPYAVRVSAAASKAATELTADAYSDAGPYVFRLESAALTYEARLSETLRDLQQQ
jgi:hypothetical protein